MLYFTFTHGITFIPVLFHVLDNDSPPIPGLKTSKDLDLIRRMMKINRCVPDYLQKYTNCFGKVGCLREKHQIVVDRDVSRVINPQTKELDRMVKMEIITPINEPTNWISSLVIVEKPNGHFPICLDPRQFNQAIKRPHFAMPTAEEILVQMWGETLEELQNRTLKVF